MKVQWVIEVRIPAELLELGEEPDEWSWSDLRYMFREYKVTDVELVDFTVIEE